MEEEVTVLVGLLLPPGDVGLSVLPPQERAERARVRANAGRRIRVRIFRMESLAQCPSASFSKRTRKTTAPLSVYLTLIPRRVNNDVLFITVYTRQKVFLASSSRENSPVNSA